MGSACGISPLDGTEDDRLDVDNPVVKIDRELNRNRDHSACVIKKAGSRLTPGQFAECQRVSSEASINRFERVRKLRKLSDLFGAASFGLHLFGNHAGNCYPVSASRTISFRGHWGL